MVFGYLVGYSKVGAVHGEHVEPYNLQQSLWLLSSQKLKLQKIDIHVQEPDLSGDFKISYRPINWTPATTLWLTQRFRLLVLVSPK